MAPAEQRLQCGGAQGGGGECSINQARRGAHAHPTSLSAPEIVTRSLLAAAQAPDKLPPQLSEPASCAVQQVRAIVGQPADDRDQPVRRHLVLPRLPLRLLPPAHRSGRTARPGCEHDTFATCSCGEPAEHTVRAWQHPLQPSSAAACCRPASAHALLLPASATPSWLGDAAHRATTHRLLLRKNLCRAAARRIRRRAHQRMEGWGSAAQAADRAHWCASPDGGSCHQVHKHQRHSVGCRTTGCWVSGPAHWFKSSAVHYSRPWSACPPAHWLDDPACSTC